MRWPSPLAQTAQPERWRMRRWSKEPRRISVVEGRAAASLARALTTDVCFIYKNETLKHRFCQYLLQHLFQNSQSGLPNPPDEMGPLGPRRARTGRQPSDDECGNGEGNRGGSQRWRGRAGGAFGAGAGSRLVDSSISMK